MCNISYFKLRSLEFGSHRYSYYLCLCGVYVVHGCSVKVCVSENVDVLHIFPLVLSVVSYLINVDIELNNREKYQFSGPVACATISIYVL